MNESDAREFQFDESQVDIFSNLMFEFSNHGKEDFNEATEEEYEAILRLIHFGKIDKQPEIGEAIWKAQNLAVKTDYPSFEEYYKYLQVLEAPKRAQEAVENAAEQEEIRIATERWLAEQARQESRTQRDEVLKTRRLSTIEEEEEEELEEEAEEEESEAEEREESDKRERPE